MPDVDLVVSCGDLPARYLEFLADALDRPVYYVLGNHAEELTRGGEKGKRYYPLGCIDLGGKVIRDEKTGLIFAGIPGSPKYNDFEPVQFTEFQVMRMMWRMAPRLLPQQVALRPGAGCSGLARTAARYQRPAGRGPPWIQGDPALSPEVPAALPSPRPHPSLRPLETAHRRFCRYPHHQRLSVPEARSRFPDRVDATNLTQASHPSATATSPMPTAAAPADPISH